MSEEENNLSAYSVVGSAWLRDLEEKATKATEVQDKHLRTLADWDNYRKRMQREKEDAIKYASEGLLEKLLPVIDNFELGLQAAQSSPNASSIVQGLTMVLSQLQNVLKEAGVEPIEAVGKPFDPNFHEALGDRPTTEYPEGTVMSQTRKGYKLKDRLLRPAAVFVAKNPAHQPVS
jgi:molecular chaperone GrpE